MSKNPTFAGSVGRSPVNVQPAQITSYTRHSHDMFCTNMDPSCLPRNTSYRATPPHSTVSNQCGHRRWKFGLNFFQVELPFGLGDGVDQMGRFKLLDCLCVGGRVDFWAGPPDGVLFVGTVIDEKGRFDVLCEV